MFEISGISMQCRLCRRIQTVPWLSASDNNSVTTLKLKPNKDKTNKETKMNLMSTIHGSNMEHYLPKGWDLNKIDECCSHDAKEVFDKQQFWNENFEPVIADNLTELNVMMGHEIAQTIKDAKDAGKKLAIIFP